MHIVWDYGLCRAATEIVRSYWALGAYAWAQACRGLLAPKKDVRAGKLYDQTRDGFEIRGEACWNRTTQSLPRDFIWFCRATLHNNLKFSWKDSKIQMQVSVRDNNVDQALRALKKKLQREGVFREMRLKEHFEKPSVRKAREQKEAVSRQRKLARKKAEREG